jgi:transcriptional regulator with XRE-family HTH domain
MYPLMGGVMAEQFDPEVGRRMEALRRRAGLSRERLAGLAGLSPTLIKFVESGRRSLTLRAAQRIAPHLGVRDLGDLYGPTVSLSLDGRVTHPGVPEVRAALTGTSWRLAVTGEPATPEYLRGAVDAAWRTWHTSPQQRSEAGALLPGLLDQAQCAARLHDGQQRRASLSMLAETLHIAQSYLAWSGDRELVWLCADRGMSAALDADDPLTIAGALWYAAHLLRGVGRPDEALERLAEARGLIEHRVADGPVEYAAMLADLHLNAALTRGRSGDQSAWAEWETASQVVRRALPDGYVHPWTRVGSTLLDVVAVMVAVDLGDPDEAQRRARSLDPATIPSTERRARHFVELARGTDLEGSREGTLMLLTKAVSVSPEVVRYSPAARDMVTRLVSEGGASIRAEAEALAHRLDLEP